MIQIDDKYETLCVLSWMLCVYNGIGDFIIIPDLVDCYIFLQNVQRLLPANSQTQYTLITNARAQCLET